MDEERKENKRPQRAAAARRKKRRRLNDLDSDSNLDEEESEDEFKISDGYVSRGWHTKSCVLGEPGLYYAVTFILRLQVFAGYLNI